MSETTALTLVDRSASLSLTPVLDVATAAARYKEMQDFVKTCMTPTEDFGIIPGTPKPTLFKPGAEKLLELYGLYPSFEMTQRVEDWAQTPAFFDYEFRCIIRSKRDETVMAEGWGSCNSYEGKYRYRQAKLMCPGCECGENELMRSKNEPAYYCWTKRGGCGRNFIDDAHRKPHDELKDQFPLGQRANPDMATQKNTILKMAKKRALVDATLGATRTSGIFTQDVEDMGGQTIDAEVIQEAGTKDKQEREATKAPAASPKPPASSTPSPITQPGSPPAKPESSKPVGNDSKPSAKKDTIKPTESQEIAGSAQSGSTPQNSIMNEKAGQPGLKYMLAKADATGWIKKDSEGKLDRTKALAQVTKMFPELKGKNLVEAMTKEQSMDCAEFFAKNNCK